MTWRASGRLMLFKSTLSTDNDTSRAVEEVCRTLAEMDYDLAIVFASHHHGPEFDDVLSAIHGGLSARNLIGCTGESIIGPDREIEQAPALAVWVACMPGVKILPFCIDQNDLESFASADEWQDRLGVSPEDDPSFVVLPEPYSIDVGACLQGLGESYDHPITVGGVASGANAPGQNRLFLNDQVLRHGMVGVSLCGPVKISTVVSQGCRPVGKSFVVTKAHEQFIAELGGRPAVKVLREVYHEADAEERELIQKGLVVGRVVDETLRRFGPGDFLIRNIMGVVEGGAIAINELVRPGQTVQFHVRDSKTATEEMRSLLRSRIDELGAAPAGGLLFSCNGRGRRMFDAPNHDIGLVNSVFGDCPVAGFFANGEIGPIGQRSFVHGLTSSLILFNSPD